MAAALPWIATAVGVIGSINQANVAAANADSAENAALWNAENNRRRGELALQQGNAREERARRLSRKEKGELRAGLVENGISLTNGTGSDLVKESSLNAELDALNIRYDAQLTAGGYQDAANMNKFEASTARAQGKQAKNSMVFGVATSVLNGVSSYQQSQASKRLYDAQVKYYES